MLKLKLASFFVNITAGVSPLISARISYAFWARTQRYPRKKTEQSCWQSANKTRLKVDGEEVAVYSWGHASGSCRDERPLILLIHGWNGRATQYFALVDSLLDRRYRVLGFDAPGHGSSPGNQTGLLQILRIVKALQKEYGAFQAIIGHSFGFIVAVNALAAGILTKTMIGISSPSDFNLLLKAYTDHFDLNPKAVTALTDYLNKRYGLKSLDEISIHHLAKQFNLPCLLLHDVKDKQVPITEAHKITNAWRGSQQYSTKGAGHLRILHNQEAIDKSITFLEKNNCAKLPDS